jgi:hypothetical protein
MAALAFSAQPRPRYRRSHHHHQCNAPQEPNHSPSRLAYHGLVRGIIRVTVDAAGSNDDRALRAAVNVDAGRGGRSSSFLPAGATPPSVLTVQATSPGLAPARISIPLSVDPADAVMAVAAASVASAYVTE